MDYKLKDEFINFKENLQNVLDKTDLYMIKSIIVEYVGRYPLCCVDTCTLDASILYATCYGHTYLICKRFDCKNIVPEYIFQEGHRICEMHLPDEDIICETNKCNNLKYIAHAYKGEDICIPYCYECM